MTRVTIFKYASFAIGVLLLTVAVTSFNSTRAFVGRASTAPGTVIDMTRSRSSHSDAYAPVVRFITDTGETIEFTSTISSSPPSYTRGERVEVLYRPQAPHDAKIGGFTSLWGGTLMFGALGSIFLLTGAGMMLSAMLNAQRAAYLTRHGKRVLTTVQRVERNDNLKVNGLNPYRIFTRWQNPSTSETRVFESDYIWFDPSSYLNGRSIAVFIEPRDPHRYYVDLSFLPKHAEQT